LEGVLPKREDPEWSRFVGPDHMLDKLSDIMGQLAVFDTLTWRELATLERIVHRRRFMAGEVVIRAFTPRSGLFAVVSGRVHVIRHRAGEPDLILDTLGEGELLGEFALLDDSPRSTSIVAAEQSELIGFFRSDLVDLIQTEPQMGFKILYRLAQVMSKRMQVVMQSLRNLREALHKELT
jgi:CRP/FNR family transcriptional regulator, cyclic AMP receptor protein